MAKYRAYTGECVICGKKLEGHIVMDFKDQMDVASQHKDNQSIAVVCPNCETSFCLEHSKEVGSKFLSGFNKVPCPGCKKLLNPHWKLMIIAGESRESAGSAEGRPQDLSERINWYGEKGDYLGALEQITSIEDLSDRSILDALRQVFEKMDSKNISSVVAKMKKDRSQLNLTRSFAVIPYMKPDIAIPALAEIHAMGLQIRVGKSASSTTFRSVDPLIQLALEQIGENGIEQMVDEIEKRNSSMFTNVVVGVFMRILNQDNWSPVIECMVRSDSNYTRFKLVSVLRHLGWDPVDREHRAYLMIAANQLKELIELGTYARKAIEKTLSCPQSMGISHKHLKKALEKIYQNV